MKFKKIMVFPSRRISLANYEAINLSAGVEIELEKGTKEEIQKAFSLANKISIAEMKKQYLPLKNIHEATPNTNKK